MPAGPARRTRVRVAVESDVPAILSLVRALAEYEREPDAVAATEDSFRTALFSEVPLVHAFVAEVAPDDPVDAGDDSIGQGPHADDWTVAGMALWFVSFSTWTGTHGIWLEDLFVRPEHRALGLGRALLAALADECTRRGWARLEWNVLDWNEPALGFYRRLGAEPLDAWTVHRLTGDALAALAADAPQVERSVTA